ncbi:ABC transporter permease [Catenulispora rubra]|uniref:ABC transporter permease n=1 Tax=Catenulispora rubra TaxID=280293 RepID=UPI0018928155|nr:ABC transporter permease [Catenulispora rubra]
MPAALTTLAAPTTRGTLAAEWVKLRSVRATYLTTLVALAAALFIGFADYQNAADAWDGWDQAERAAFDPVRYGFSGAFYLAVLAMGTLGTLAAGNEYATGQIRSTLTAVPRRGQVLVAKALIVGGVTLAVGEVLAFGTFVLGQNALSAKHLDVSLDDPGVARAVVGCGVFLAAMALIGLALGFLIRRSAGAVAALFGLFFLSPMVFGVFGDGPQKFGLQAVFEGLSTTAAGADMSTRPDAGMAYAILAGYVVLALGSAAYFLKRRDA